MNIDLAWWCHNAFGPKWGIETFCKRAISLGAVGIELVPVEHWQNLRDWNLRCPVAILDYGKGGPAPFEIGWNDPADHERVTVETLRQIGFCKAFNGVCNAVIAFSGMRKSRMGQPNAIGNCVNGIRNVIKQAEDAGVTLLFEPLNDHAEGAAEWCGHPGYDATTLDYALKVVQGVGSPNLQILLDLYHRQRQEGDVIEAIRVAMPYIGHVHVAGLGPLVRREMNFGCQELNYRDVFKYLRACGYTGGVGIEYIPTPGRPYLNDLRAAKRLIG